MMIGYVFSAGMMVYADEPYLTRAQLAMVLADLVEVPFDESMEETVHFIDIDPISYEYEAIVVCKYLGIMSGFSDDTFRPGESVTRAQLAVSLCNTVRSEYFVMPGYEPKPIDISNSHWSYKFVCTALQHGFMSVYGDNSFRPDSQAVRSDINDAAVKKAIRNWTPVSTFLADIDTQDEIASTKKLGGYPFALDSKGEIDLSSFIIGSDSGDYSLSDISEDDVVTICLNKDGNIYGIAVGTKMVKGYVTDVDFSSGTVCISANESGYGRDYKLNPFAPDPLDFYEDLKDNIAECLFYLDYSGKVFRYDEVNTANSDFTFDASTGTITGYTGSDSFVVIPSEIGGNSVTAIAHLGEQETIKEIVIPASVTEIETNAFGVCPNLASIQVDANNSYYCSKNGILFGRDGKELIRFPRGKSGTYSVPAGVETISANAFCDIDHLTSVVLPSGVVTISEEAFLDCWGLTEITLPDSIRTVGESAFENCTALTDVYYAGTEELWETIKTKGRIKDKNDPLLNAKIHFGSSASGDAVMIGDVNADGKVNATDRRILARYLAKWSGYEEQIASWEAADINKDGKVNATDRRILARYLAKWGGEYDGYFK